MNEELLFLLRDTRDCPDDIRVWDTRGENATQEETSLSWDTDVCIRVKNVSLLKHMHVRVW